MSFFYYKETGVHSALLRPAAEKSWIDSTLIMSLGNGGEWGQKGPYATANLNQ